MIFNIIIYVLASYGCGVLTLQLLKFLYGGIKNITAYIKSIHRPKSTKYFKEIKIKE
jgi:hypothetical protein